jgi:hypothetical protein
MFLTERIGQISVIIQNDQDRETANYIVDHMALF